MNIQFVTDLHFSKPDIHYAANFVFIGVTGGCHGNLAAVSHDKVGIMTTARPQCIIILTCTVTAFVAVKLMVFKAIGDDSNK